MLSTTVHLPPLRISFSGALLSPFRVPSFFQSLSPYYPSFYYTFTSPPHFVIVFASLFTFPHHSLSFNFFPLPCFNFSLSLTFLASALRYTVCSSFSLFIYVPSSVSPLLTFLNCPRLLILFLSNSSFYFTSFSPHHPSSFLPPSYFFSTSARFPSLSFPSLLFFRYLFNLPYLCHVSSLHLLSVSVFLFSSVFVYICLPLPSLYFVFLFSVLPPSLCPHAGSAVFGRGGHEAWGGTRKVLIAAPRLFGCYC